MANFVQRKITGAERFLKEGWFAGLFDETRFKSDSSPQETYFQTVETKVNDTSIVDTYDLVFNLQMPSIANTKFFQTARNKNTVDYYCNNKIHIRLYFKDESIFDNLVGTECVISPYILKGQTRRTSDGIYFASLNDLRKRIREATSHAITDGTPFEYDKEKLVMDNNDPPKPKRRDASKRSGPFAESQTGFTHENIVKKLKTNIVGKNDYLDNYIKYVGEKIKPGEKDSPFQEYKTRYSRSVSDDIDDIVENTKKLEPPGLVSKTNFMSIEEKRRYFNREYQYFMQFDFDLNEYKLDKDGDGNLIVVKKNKGELGEGNTALIDTDDSLIMLLKKNQWFSIVFKNINIPFDIKEIPSDVVKLEFQIENISPPDSIGEANIFYKNFFCEFLNMFFKNKIETPIKVHDVMFQYNDMVNAIYNKSEKYFSKISQLNYIARKVIYYYLKNLDEVDGNRYTNLYNEMMAAIKNSQEKTVKLITEGTSKVISKNKTELTQAVKDADDKIKIFSDIFRRDNIKVFRKHFLSAIMRTHQKTGLSSISDTEILAEYKRIMEFIKIAKTGKVPNEPSNVMATRTKFGEGAELVAARTGSIAINPAQIGGGMIEYQTGGYDEGSHDSIVSYQTGGGNFNSEDYNLMIPMNIHSMEDGINNMVVRVHKIHLQAGVEIINSGESRKQDDDSSVDIKVGDAVRFVYDNDIVYAIICGFKPGKPLNKDGSDKAMNMNDFYKTYKDIRATLESSNLKMSPQEFLSLTNLRGIKFLPFKYNDESYSFTPYDGGKIVSESQNSNLKKGLNGKFVFSCKDDKIPILPNGYVLPFVSRVKENISTGLNKLNPFSTKADIGKDNKLPQYSLPSYMTLEKVFVPPNFSEVIKELKEFRDDNPDDILKKLIKIMETNGLNDSNDCKKTSVKIAASNAEIRKKDFQTELKRINGDFKNQFLPKGQLINRKGAIKYIQNLYKQTVKEGVFVNSNGEPIRTATKLVFALNLIPTSPVKSMDLLIRALSQEGVLSMSERNKELSKKITSREEQKIKELNDGDLIEKYDGGGDIGVQYGGAEDINKAKQIIRDTIDLLQKQQILNDKAKSDFISNLDSAEANYNPDEPDPTVVASSSTSLVKSGVHPGTGFGSGTGSASNFLSNFFNKGSMGSSSSGMGSGNGIRIGNDSCGNNTSIICNNEDLVITVTLKLNELIASCMNHQMIQDYGSQPGNFQQIMNGEEGQSAPSADSSSQSAAVVVSPAQPAVNTSQPAVNTSQSATDAAAASDTSPPAVVVDPQPASSQSAGPTQLADASKPASSPPAVVVDPQLAAATSSQSTVDASKPAVVVDPQLAAATSSQSTADASKPAADAPPQPAVVVDPQLAAATSSQSAVESDSSSQSAVESVTSSQPAGPTQPVVVAPPADNPAQPVVDNDTSEQARNVRIGGYLKNNNSKSNKNRKSNKNKTKKRKSNSRKIKFTKV